MPKGEHQKEKKYTVWQLANVLIIAVGVLVTAILLVFLQRPTVSETEQRELTKFPEFSWESLFSGEYTAQISEFYNDTIPNRDSFKQLTAVIRKSMGISVGGVTIQGDIQKITTEAYDEPEDTVATSSTAAENSGDVSEEKTTEVTTEEITEATTERPANEIAPGVITNGQIIAYIDGNYRAISLYGGGSGKNYASYVNEFAERLDGVNVYSMVVPTSGAYYTPSNFDEYNASHLDSINSINSKLSDKVTAVDGYSALLEHVDEDIYLRTDHHWAPLGAYYAAQAFAEAAGVPFADISTMERRDIEGYVGTMYSFTQSADLLNDPEVFTYYVPANDFRAYYYDTAYNYDGQYPFFLQMPVSSSYSTFMGGDQKIVRIDTDVDNGRVLAVFKDSYGNAEIPFYFGSFSSVYVLDMRYFDLSVDFLKEQGVTDLLFTMCTFSAVGDNAEDLNTILSR